MLEPHSFRVIWPERIWEEWRERKRKRWDGGRERRKEKCEQKETKGEKREEEGYYDLWVMISSNKM